MRYVYNILYKKNIIENYVFIIYISRTPQGQSVKPNLT